MSRTQLTLLVNVALILTMATNAWAQPPQTFHKFKLVQNSNIDTVISDQHSKTQNDVVVFYSLSSNSPTRYLSIHALDLKSKIDGKEVMDDFFSRKKLAKTKDGSTYELGPDQITGPLKTVVQDSFDTTLSKLETDRSGTNVKRTMEAGPGANMIIQKGIVDDALLFHPPFPTNQNEWQTNCEFGMGNGGIVTGKLGYKKISSGVDGKVTVNVSGTLSNDGFEDRQAQMTIKHASYVFQGKQIYDLTQQEWISGDMAIEITIQQSRSGSNSSDLAKGTQSLHFEQLPDNQ